MRNCFVIAGAALTLLAVHVQAQTGEPQGPQPSEPVPEPPPVVEAAEEKWSFSASLTLYVVPDDQEYLQPTFTADHDWLHLEARYNYEDLDTASIWAGYNLSGGKEFTWEITPMIGGVFGETNGMAPGYELTLNWWKLELYSEGEYVFDFDESSDSYFYNWSQLTISPVDWFWFGLAAQRTRLYEGDRDIQRGLIVGFTFENVELSASALNLDDSEPIYQFSVQVSF